MYLNSSANYYALGQLYFVFISNVQMFVAGLHYETTGNYTIHLVYKQHFLDFCFSVHYPKK